MPRMPEGFPHLSPKSEAKNIEARIEELLSLLPDEVRQKWEEKHEEEDDGAQLASLEELMTKRAKIRNPHTEIDAHERPRLVPTEETYPLAIKELIERIEQDAHTVLGEGKAARVVASVRNPDVCYKVMLPIDQVPRGTNSVAVEADIQMALSALGEIASVRVPRVLAYIEHEDMRAIMMETLDAVSIRDLHDGKESWPEAFDSQKFFKALERFVAVLHDHGYHHCDLHEGNVLIDRESGNPRVIDFGYSKRVFGEDNPYRREYVRSGQKQELVLPSDIGCLHGLKSVVREAYPTKRGHDGD